MRDPKRINILLELIEKIWKQNTDLRLCQLLCNCFNENDLYYIEDNMLKEKLKKVYLNNEEGSKKANKED